MSLRGCSSGHSFVVQDLGAGLQRQGCVECATVVIDLDEVADGGVTAPGLFRPSRPTIFSVLGEEERAEERRSEQHARTSGPSGPRYAFSGAAARR